MTSRNMIKCLLKSRKAEGEREIIVDPLISIAGLIVLIVLISIIFSGSDRQASDKLCLANTLASASMKKGSLVDLDPLKLVNCPTYIVDVKSGDIDDRGKIGDAKKYMNNLEIKFRDPDLFKSWPDEPKMAPEIFVVNKMVAEEMRSCWTKLGQGKLDLFSAWEGFERTSTYCVICSRIAFDEKAQNFIKNYNEDREYNSIISSMNVWLKNNPVPGTKMSYWEYFKDDETPESDLFIDYTYDTSQPLAVVFTRIATGAGVEGYNAAVGLANSVIGYGLPLAFSKVKFVLRGGKMLKLGIPLMILGFGIEAITGKTLSDALGVKPIESAQSIDKLVLVKYDADVLSKLCVHLMN